MATTESSTQSSTTTAAPTTTTVEVRDVSERKPPLTNGNILMMTVGFFGVAFGFGMTQSAVNPLFLLIGAQESQLPILNIAGPITGLFIQPLIGAMSDKQWSDKRGRRKPYIIFGALLGAATMLVFPFVGALWLGVVCLWMLDIGNNTASEPYRAFLSDRLPRNQLAKGFLYQSFYGGAGAVLANLSLFVLQKFFTGATGNGVYYWMYACFWIGTVSAAFTVMLAMRKGPSEIRPDDAELEEMRNAPKGIVADVKDIAGAVRTMPAAMHKIGLVFFFQWYAMFIYWQFIAVSYGETIFNANAEKGGDSWSETVAWAGLGNGTYNLFTMIAALFLIGWCQRIGAKKVQAVCLGLAGVSLCAVSQVSNQYVALLCMIGLGIFWASAIGLPSMMVSTLVPAKQTGVYLGILNMMIVVPMLIQTVTFGWVFTHLLDSSGSNAILLAGAMLLCGGVAMLWVDPPPEDQESSLVPLGAPRNIRGVYDQVVVGSDGSPTSLVAVGHAAGVAHAADARLVVVTAYQEGAATSGGTAVKSARTLVSGRNAAEAAMRDSMEAVQAAASDSRIKKFDQKVYEGSPADALLDAAGDNPKNLIVVGNRGLDAEEGAVLGSVPMEVARRALCNVLIVQTTRHAEDLQAMTNALEVPRQRE